MASVILVRGNTMTASRRLISAATRVAWTIVALGFIASAACSHSSPNPLTPQVGKTSAVQQHSGFELTGTITGDDGRVLPGATVYVNFQPTGGGHFIGTSATADSTGKYDVVFDAVQGAYLEGSTALVLAGPDGYEYDYRWFRPSSPDRLQTLDLHPRAIIRINAGDTASVTVTPDDPPCINNTQDFPGLGPDYTCRTIRIVASATGMLSVEAVPQDGQTTPQLETEIVGGTDEDLGNPRVMNVSAGQVIKASVELLAGLPAQTFQLKTSIASSGRAGQ